MQATVRRGQKGRPLVPIPGAPPNLVALPPGLRVRAALPARARRCPTTVPSFHPVAAGHAARCHLVPSASRGREPPRHCRPPSTQGGLAMRRFVILLLAPLLVTGR